MGDCLGAYQRRGQFLKGLANDSELPGNEQVMGAALAFIAGIFYFFFLFVMGWETGWGWVIIAVIFAAGVVVALTMIFPPKSPWLYPGMFSLITFLVGALALVSGDQPPAVVGTWFGIGVATVAVGFCSGYLAHVVSRRRSTDKR